jgi:hypothetical protein
MSLYALRDVRQQLRSLPDGQGLSALARVEREMLLKVYTHLLIARISDYIMLSEPAADMSAHTLGLADAHLLCVGYH